MLTHSDVVLNIGVKASSIRAMWKIGASWTRDLLLYIFSRWVPASWAWVLSALHFLSLLEDAEVGQPRRLSQVRCMIWGAMIVGVSLIGKVQLTGEPITWTEGGFASLITIVAGLMKFNRDRQDQDSGRGRWGSYGGGQDRNDEPAIDPFSDPE